MIRFFNILFFFLGTFALSNCFSECNAACDDEIWMVSTRHLGCPTANAPQLLAHRLIDGCWEPADINLLLADDPEGRLPFFFIHGNRVESHETTPTALGFYRALTRATHKPMESSNERPALRYIIWSWPSDQVRGARRDARLKADRAHWEAYYFGRFLRQLKTRRPISIVGYSFGARAMFGGLHLENQGCLCDRVLSQEVDVQDNQHRISTERNVRAVALAPATNFDALLPNSIYAKALERIDRLVVCFNPSDPLLKLYPYINLQQNRTAMGLSGAVGPANNERFRITNCNVANAVGSNHSVDGYESECVMQQIRGHLFWRSQSKR